MGELIANQFSVGLSRMARLVKERMSINSDPEKISLDDLVNARTVSAPSSRRSSGRSQLSQFMDQTNPLAELTNKRRLSALGSGRPDARARRASKSATCTTRSTAGCARSRRRKARTSA